MARTTAGRMYEFRYAGEQRPLATVHVHQDGTAAVFTDDQARYAYGPTKQIIDLKVAVSQPGGVDKLVRNRTLKRMEPVKPKKRRRSNRGVRSS